MKDMTGRDVSVGDRVLVMNSEEEGVGGVVGKVTEIHSITVTLETGWIVRPDRNPRQFRVEMGALQSWLLVLAP